MVQVLCSYITLPLYALVTQVNSFICNHFLVDNKSVYIKMNEFIIIFSMLDIDLN